MNSSYKPNQSGIYKIVNKINGKAYYGSTRRSFNRRWIEHKNQLKNNEHDNEYLQHAWNKYGGNNFELIILFLCDPYACIFYEQIILDLVFDNKNNCYNICPIAGSCLGSKRSEEVKKKTSGRKHSEESKNKMSIEKTGKKRMPFSEAAKQNMSKSHTGIKRKPFTEEHKKKIRKVVLGKMSSNNTSGYVGVSYEKYSKKYRARITINGKIKNLGMFNTAEEAAEAYQKELIKIII